MNAAGLSFTDSSRYLFCRRWIPHRLLFWLGLTLGSSSTCFCSVQAMNPSHRCLPLSASSALYLYSVFWQMEVGEIFLLSSQPLYFHSFRFITLRPALLYSAPHLKYVPKSWWPLLARLLYFPANFFCPLLFSPLIRRPPHLSFLLLLSNFLCSNEMLYTEGSVRVPYQRPLASGIRWREIGLK